MQLGRRTVASALALAAVAFGGCGVLSTSPAAGTFTPRTPGVLTVVTSDLPTPGFWEGTAEHPTGGFEYELARMLAQRFEMHALRIEIVKFHRLVGGNMAGADVALDLITPTAERKRKLQFSTAYLTDAPTVVVRRGTTIRDLATAQDLRWGAIRATTFVEDIQTLVDPDQPVRTFDDQPEMLAALESKQIDAVMFDLPLAVAISDRSNGRLKVAAQLPTPEPIAAALPKGSGNRQAVDSAIRAFIADGTVDRLLRKWVGPAAASADKSIPLLHTTR